MGDRTVASFWAGLYGIGKITPPFQPLAHTLYSPARDGREGRVSFDTGIALRNILESPPWDDSP